MEIQWVFIFIRRDCWLFFTKAVQWCLAFFRIAFKRESAPTFLSFSILQKYTDSTSRSKCIISEHIPYNIGFVLEYYFRSKILSKLEYFRSDSVPQRLGTIGERTQKINNVNQLINIVFLLQMSSVLLLYSILNISVYDNYFTQK